MSMEPNSLTTGAEVYTTDGETLGTVKRFAESTSR